MDRLRQSILLTFLAIVAILAAGWFLLIKPKSNAVAEKRTEVETQQAANAQLRARIAMLRELAKDLPAQQARLAEIQRRIPGNPALPALIRALSDAASTSGVDLVSLSPGPPALLAAAPAAPVAPVATGTPVGGAVRPGAALTSGRALAQIPVTIVVSGGYFQIEQFFSNTEALQRSMLVTGVSVAPATGGGPAGSPAGRLVSNITGRVYLTTTPPAPVAAPTAPAE